MEKHPKTRQENFLPGQPAGLLRVIFRVYGSLNSATAVLQHSVQDQGHSGVMRKAGRVGHAPQIRLRLPPLPESGRLALGNDLTWWVSGLGV